MTTEVGERIRVNAGPIMVQQFGSEDADTAFWELCIAVFQLVLGESFPS